MRNPHNRPRHARLLARFARDVQAMLPIREARSRRHVLGG